MRRRDPRNFIDIAKWPLLETLIVDVPSTFTRSKPRPSASAGTQLIYGQRFNVHRRGRGWVWGQSVYNLPGAEYSGYVGWVRGAHLGGLQKAPEFKVTVLSAPVFKASSIKSPVLMYLPLGAQLTGQASEGFLELANGFVDLKHTDPVNAQSRAKDWVAIAESMIGQPYIWGGVSSHGLDCTGLVQTSLRMFGLDAPRDSDQQAGLGEAVPITSGLLGLKRGDLVFWQGHVGIMMSPTRLLHANAFHMIVATEPLKTAATRIVKSAGPITAIRRLNF